MKNGKDTQKRANISTDKMNHHQRYHNRKNRSLICNNNKKNEKYQSRPDSNANVKKQKVQQRKKEKEKQNK